MPIYEYFCPECNTIYSFFSRSVSPGKKPACPVCKRKNLERQISLFTAGGGSGKKELGEDFPVDEARMEKAVTQLAGEAGNINENDPKQAAQLMRKFSGMTGLKFNDGIQEALQRLEKGEDPDKIESEMGNLMEGDNPFQQSGDGKGTKNQRKPNQPVKRDPGLYELS